jgi:N-acyl-phosphatidylethanolamine-hydrolysing phospholipase D
MARACTLHTHPWYTRQHHTPTGFQNLTPAQRDGTAWDAAQWIAKRALTPRPASPPPVRAPEGWGQAPDRLRITWLGHTAMLVQWPGFTILTDPMFSHYASPVPGAGPRRQPGLVCSVHALPPVDVVLLSHDHYDHLDRTSVRRIARRLDPLFVVPLGVGAHLRRWGIDRVVERDWGQYVALPGRSAPDAAGEASSDAEASADGPPSDGAWQIHCTPARHFSGRGLLDRDQTLWASWYVTPPEGTGRPTLYFGGDTAYDDHFTAIRDRHGAPDVALLPIGAYRPRWFMQPVHVDPGEAVQAGRDLGARHLLPTHWGTFDLGDEPLDEPPQRLRAEAEAAGCPDRWHVLDIGASWAWPEAGPTPDGMAPSNVEASPDADTSAPPVV